MTKRAGLVLLAAACGSPAPAVVQLPQAASASAAPASPKMPAAGCALQWNACRRVGEPVRVSGTSIGQSPEVAWDGREALVTFDAAGEGVHLAAVDERGRVLWIEALPGTNAQIAWNPRTRTGLVVTSETIAWLGHDGKPLHRTNAPHLTNVTFHDGTFATKDGFIVGTGVASHASNATLMPFSVATTSAPADAIDWKPAGGDGLRHAPLGGPEGSLPSPPPASSARRWRSPTRRRRARPR